MMRKPPFSLLYLSACCISVNSFGAAASEQTDTASLDEVVVTATKSGEVSAQKIPAAISVFSEEKIQEANLNSLEDIKTLTPNLDISRNGNAGRLYLRGIGTNLDFVGSDPSVALQVDGVYQARGYATFQNFVDIERVEVMRGPQGTLYGRNSTGGTINIISKTPEATPKANVSLSGGNFNAQTVSVAGSGGLGSDQLIGSLALQKSKHDASFDNENSTGVKGVQDEDAKHANASVRSLFGKRGEFILRGDYHQEKNAPTAYKSTGLGLDGSPAPMSALVKVPADPFHVNINVMDPFLEQTSSGESAELNWNLSSQWRITSVTGFRKLDFNGLEDTDSSNVSVLVTELDEAENQWSEELRAQYKNADVSWVTGFFWLTEKNDSDVRISVVPRQIQTRYLASNDTDAQALFSHVTFPLVPQLNATLGIRASQETKQFQNNNLLILTGSNAQVNQFSVNQQGNWYDFSPKFALDYQWDKTTLLYASASKGFKSGGFNLTARDAKFDQEKVWAYEIGSKLEWLNHSGRTNFAAFYYNYADLQVSDFTSPGVVSISNAAAATNKGLEMENEWLPDDNWTLELNLALLDARYDKYLAPVGTAGATIDVSGNYLNAAPRHQASTAARYQMHLAQALFSVRVQYSWQDKTYFTAFNQDVSSQDAYGLVNAQVRLDALNKCWSAELFGNNLTDKAYSTSSREFPASATGVTKDINPPRTLGARVTYQF